MIFEPLDFIARLASLVPAPFAHLTRFHGVFAPNSKHRADVIREPPKEKQRTALDGPAEHEDRRLKMNWAMRLKRAFNIDVTRCSNCQGLVRIIACVEERAVINKILGHILQKQKVSSSIITSLEIRAPPTERISQWR